MTYQCKQVDIGDKCVECLRSTSFGTGLFVNSIPADNDEYIGWYVQNVTIMSVIAVMKRFIVMKIVHLMTFMTLFK